MSSEPASVMITVLARGLGLLLVWWVLTLGQWSALLFGSLVVVPVAVLSVRLFPPSGFHLRPLALVGFAGYFLGQSVLAGVDVARRLVLPSLPIQAGETILRTRLPPGSPRWLLANTLSLMPGTLSVWLEGDCLKLHCLDVSMETESSMRATEQRIARLFGIALASGEVS